MFLTYSGIQYTYNSKTQGREHSKGILNQSKPENQLGQTISPTLFTKSVYVKTLFKSPTPFIFVGSNTLLSLFGALLIRYPTTLEFLTSWVLQCDSSFNLIVLCNGFSSRSPFRNTTDTCLDSAVQSIILTVGSMFAYLVIVF